MYKLIGMACILAGTAGFSLGLYGEHLERIRQLKRMEESMHQMESEISYGKADFCELCHLMSMRAKGVYEEFFRALYLDMKINEGVTFSDLWHKHSNTIGQIKVLRKSDIELFATYPPETGYLDGDMQIEEIKRKRRELSSYIAREEEKLRNNQKLYLTMGFMGGVFLVILLL